MKFFFTIILFITCFFADAQKLTGQWKGEFVDNSTSFIGWGGERCQYTIELSTKAKKVSGFSYTYFSDGGKRYYTICRLEGLINTASKSIEVREVERTKTNVPNTIRNCFQVHRLTFVKEGNEERLQGNWVPAPDQEGDCGFGTTVLIRRTLKKMIPQYNTSTARTGTLRNNKLPDLRDRNKIVKPLTPPTVIKKSVIQPPVAKNTNIEKQRVETPAPPVAGKEIVTDLSTESNLEKRNNTLVKTIELEHENFKVDIYDNGDIDGDTISLIYNGKLLLSHKRLSDKALSLTLTADNANGLNELVMYAENLGEIPPNTAAMVVTDGDRRYEVRITSDLQKSGTIKFIHKPRPPQ